jgi:hypothetical protein
VLNVGLAVDNVLSARREIPQGDTTKVRLVLDLAHNFGELLRGQVAGTGNQGARVGGQTEVDLGVRAGRAGGDNVLPLGVGELTGDRVDLAHLVVVELDKQGVKPGLLDQITQVEELVRRRALGSSSNERVGVQLTEALNHGNVTIVVGELMLNVKVETVDDSVLSRANIKGTRASP